MMLSRTPVIRSFVLPFLRARTRTLLWIFLLSVVESAPALVSGFAVARAVDSGFLAHRPIVGFGWLGVFALSAAIGALGTRLSYPRTAELVEPFRDRMVEMVVRGVLGRSVWTGDAPDTAGVARLTHQVEIVRDAFGGLIMVSRTVLFSIGGAAIGMATLQPLVLPLVLPPLIAGIALFWALLPPVARRQRDLILADEHIAERSSTAIGGLRDVVACGAEDVIGRRVGTAIDAQARATRAVAGATALRDLSIAIGGLLPVLLVLLAAGWLGRHGATAGMLVGTLTYLLQAVLPALQTMTRGLGGSIVRIVVTLGRIAEAAEATHSVTVTPTGAVLADDVLDLRAASFAYGPHATPVIDRLTLRIEPGEHLAVVGPSGIGKSTLAALLTGMLSPTSGTVAHGGCPTDAIPIAERGCHRVLIPQEAYVFTGTVRDNITYFAEASDSDIAAAVAALGAGSLLDRLGGMDAEVEPGALSAGERQLIALLRAYLSPARIVVLDEATCHLDPTIEARVEEAFAGRGGTLIVIAHRISSAVRARRILLLDGSNAAFGDHDTLLRTTELYPELVGHWDASELAR